MALGSFRGNALPNIRQCIWPGCVEHVDPANRNALSCRWHTIRYANLTTAEKRELKAAAAKRKDGAVA